MQPPQETSEWFNPSEDQSSDPAQPQVVATPQPVPVMVGAAQPGVVGAGQPMMIAGSPSAFPVQPMMGGGIPTTNATLALILSIVSIFAGGICLAIPALIIANGALAVTNQFPGHPDASNAKAAQVISWIIIGLTALVIVGIILLIFVGSMAP